MFILYCCRAIAKDLRLVRKISELCAGLTIVIEEREHFIDELDILVDRIVSEKMVKFMKETQGKEMKKLMKNTIELPIGYNVVPLRSETIRLVQNGCSFHGLRSEDPNQHLKDLLKLVDSLDLYGANRERTSQALLEDLALYDNKNWNDPRDFAKPGKAIALPQDVPSTSDRRHHRRIKQSTNLAIQLYNPKLSTPPVLSAHSYPTIDPQCSSHPSTSINAIKAHSKEATVSQINLLQHGMEIEPQQPDEPEPTLEDEFQLHLNYRFSKSYITPPIRNDILRLKYVVELD
ncbi:hypothetical protein Tco_0851218 [Tanacetum coccineum]